MNLVFVLLIFMTICNIDANIHPITELDHVFCMYNYQDEIKHMRRFPGKESVHAEAFNVSHKILNSGRLFLPNESQLFLLVGLLIG